MGANRDLLRKLDSYISNYVSYDEAYFLLQSVYFMALSSMGILHGEPGKATLHLQVQGGFEALLESIPPQVVPQATLQRLVAQAMAVLKRGIEVALPEPGEQRALFRLLSSQAEAMVASQDYDTILKLTGSASHDADPEEATTYADTILTR